jgi:hypothetical protein
VRVPAGGIPGKPAIVLPGPSTERCISPYKILRLSRVRIQPTRDRIGQQMPDQRSVPSGRSADPTIHANLQT